MWPGPLRLFSPSRRGPAGADRALVLVLPLTAALTSRWARRLMFTQPHAPHQTRPPPQLGLRQSGSRDALPRPCPLRTGYVEFHITGSEGAPVGKPAGATRRAHLDAGCVLAVVSAAAVNAAGPGRPTLKVANDCHLPGGSQCWPAGVR